MSDLIDVLNEAGLRTGEVLPRKEIHKQGRYHRAIHLYLINRDNEILLQRRSMTVDHYPGVFGISATGHIDAGESSSTTVKREVKEELGLDSSKMKFDFLFSFYQEAKLSETYIDRQFNDVYICRANPDPAKIKFDRNEVSEVKFVPFAEFKEMVDKGTGGLAPVYKNECQDLVYFLQGQLFMAPQPTLTSKKTIGKKARMSAPSYDP